MTIPQVSNTVNVPPVPMYKRDSSLAITSLVCGLVGWTFIPLIGAVAAVITGHLAKKEIRESNGLLSGDGMAMAGLILGYTQIGLIVLAVVCVIAFAFAIAAGVTSGFSGLSAYTLGVL